VKSNIDIQSILVKFKITVEIMRNNCNMLIWCSRNITY